MAFPTTTGQALEDRQTLKSYFQYGDVPTEANYATLLDKLATITELNEEQVLREAADTAEEASRIEQDTAIRAEFAAEDVRIEGLISSNDAELADLQAADATFLALIGLTALASDLGTFQGTTIDNGSSVKEALQALETAHEIEISTTNTEIAAHDTRLATLEATTILDSFIFACSSNIGNIATGDASTFRMPYGFTCTEVRASLITNTASSAVSLKVFVDGTAITDQVDIAAGATTTYQVGVASTFLLGQNSSPQPIAMDSEVKVNVTAAPTGATGLKVTLVGYVGTCAINVVGGSITFPITFPLGTVNTLITCTG